MHEISLPSRVRYERTFPLLGSEGSTRRPANRGDPRPRARPTNLRNRNEQNHAATVYCTVGAVQVEPRFRFRRDQKKVILSQTRRFVSENFLLPDGRLDNTMEPIFV